MKKSFKFLGREIRISTAICAASGVCLGTVLAIVLNGIDPIEALKSSGTFTLMMAALVYSTSPKTKD